VGSWVELSHLAPTPVGAVVTVRARLTEADHRTLVFEFSVSDGSGQIARGTHRRVVVDRDRFLEHAHQR
jgi:predicted thioesterase